MTPRPRCWAREYVCEECGHSVDVFIDDPYYHETPMWCNDCDERMRMEDE